MAFSRSRADLTAALLSAAGFESTQADHADHIRFDVTIPVLTSTSAWLGLLRALDTADRFGVVSSDDTGRSAWALIYPEAD